MLAETLGKLEVKIVAARENVGEVKRTIKNVTECGRVIVNTLPHYYLTPYITIHLIYFIVMWLNSLQDGEEISQEYSPREIVTGQHRTSKLL